MTTFINVTIDDASTLKRVTDLFGGVAVLSKLNLKYQIYVECCLSVVSIMVG